jgi:hypothetical protein
VIQWLLLFLEMYKRPRREEGMEGCRKLHNEELRDLYPSPSIIRIFKSRRMGWAGACSTNGGEEDRV